MMERRSFLLGGAGLALVAGVGIWGADVFSQQEIVSGVRRKLSFLQLDDAGLHAFAKDYINSMLAKRPSWYRWKVHFHSLFSKPGAARWGISDDKRSKRETLTDSLSTLFMLSSDFFVSGADESKVVGHVSLYDPMRACGNPFARPATIRQPRRDDAKANDSYRAHRRRIRRAALVMLRKTQGARRCPDRPVDQPVQRQGS